MLDPILTVFALPFVLLILIVCATSVSVVVANEPIDTVLAVPFPELRLICVPV